MDGRIDRSVPAHRRFGVATAVAVLLSAFAPPALASPGELDPSFGSEGTGMVTTPFPGGAFASGVAVQADGKLVVVGAAAGESGAGEFAVARYRTDGSPDASFDGDGSLTTPIAGGGAGATSVAIQTNGRIVVVGTDGGHRFAVARYRRNGALDAGFGEAGIVRTNLTARGDVAYAIAIQDDGKIVVAGSAGSRRRFAVVRYRRNGALDRSFGDGGKVLAIRRGVARAMALQPDGRIVVVGYGPFGLTVARFLPDGSLDPTFGDDGVVRRVSSEIFALAVAFQSNGRILVGGDYDIFAFGLARFTRRGRLDTTFGGDGIVRTPMPGPAEQAVTDLVIQADGRIVAAGYVVPHESIDEGEPAFALARYRRDGRLDRSWGGNGMLLTHFEGGAGANGAVAQADGRIVAVGGAGGFDAAPAFALARYLVD